MGIGFGKTTTLGVDYLLLWERSELILIDPEDFFIVKFFDGGSSWFPNPNEGA